MGNRSTSPDVASASRVRWQYDSPGRQRRPSGSKTGLGAEHTEQGGSGAFSRKLHSSPPSSRLATSVPGRDDALAVYQFGPQAEHAARPPR